LSMHPKDEDTYPEGTVVRFKKSGKLAVIKKRAFMMDGKGFLHYLGAIEGRQGEYAIYHDDVDLVALPPV
jgi:hypothetical protein